MGLAGWIPIMVYFKHQIYLERLKTGGRGGDERTIQALQELRREVQELRENTTKFDMSFDAALTRLETRVDGLDARVAAGRRETDSAPRVTLNRE